MPSPQEKTTTKAAQIRSPYCTNTINSCIRPPTTKPAFFVQAPVNQPSSELTIHNLSTYKLTQDDLQLLDKGLTFSPTPNTPTKELHRQILHHFNDFARSLRLKYAKARYTKQKHQPPPQQTTTSLLYRQMKFLPPPKPETYITQYSGFSGLENYIDNTKQNIADNLPALCSSNNKPNLSHVQQRSLNQLQKARQTVTIKPADKNLGIVLMNTDDYIKQCMLHLTDKSTYRLAANYPSEQIQKQLTNILAAFKPQLETRDRWLYKFLKEPPRNPRTPVFYGIPKIHKEYSHLPPLRPIVSQSSSLLSPTAHFIDFVLQPLALSYPDYLHNSTALSLILQSLYVPDDAILVTTDVVSLYPSIPQTQCLEVVYNELHAHKHLLLFDPNLIIQLLQTNINYNYFTFDNLTFQQIKGTAMGAPFSPTVANIFMSVILRDFLQTQHKQPLLITQYIDDIFMIWTDSADTLDSFLHDLNSFHTNIQFTHKQSPSTIDFLDLTIYKGFPFHVTNILDTKTLQKQLNLYQYLHYTSFHPKNIFKAIIKGECIRYIRTNTMYDTYEATIHTFKKRLRKRNYPNAFINKTIATVKYSNRSTYLQRMQPQGHTCTPPLYKSLPPPQYNLLKQLVLQEYGTLHFMSPRFIALKHPTLQSVLVRSRQRFSVCLGCWDTFCSSSMSVCVSLLQNCCTQHTPSCVTLEPTNGDAH